MQIKFSLIPNDYFNVANDYYSNSGEGKKNWRMAQYKMTIPILIIIGIFYYLHRDPFSVLLLLLVSVAALFIKPFKFVVKRYQKRLMKEDYADKFKETTYWVNEKGVATYNKEKREQFEWKDVKVRGKTRDYIWLKTGDGQFLIFPKIKFETEEEFETLYADVQKFFVMSGAKA